MQTRTETIRPGTALQVLFHLPRLLRLYWRLFRDPRVSFWPKALLVSAVLYVLLPFDLLPDVLPFVGQVDDAVVVLMAARWFVQWCPQEVVREHVQTLSSRMI